MTSKVFTKAEVLEDLLPKLKNAKVLPQIRFVSTEWDKSKDEILKRIRKKNWDKIPLIVRSSAALEDLQMSSMAGHYMSILNVCSENELLDAVSEVIKSLDSNNGKDQVFIQPMLQKVRLSGVAFSKDPSSGAPYIVINYDDKNHIPNTVTSGISNDLRTYYYYKYTKTNIEKPLSKIIDLIFELEELLLSDSIDIEFAIDEHNDLYLLQVRPLVVQNSSKVSKLAHIEVIDNICKKIHEAKKPHPYLFGKRTVYGVMPDWNPAEIIGIRPRPLALSLYKEIITDNIWAYQRDNYGYRNLRSFPLLISLYGLPYIDVRVSFNSFVPRDVEDDLAERLVNYYIDRLIETPSHHDKVEFEIIFSCYTLDLPQRLSVLLNYGFNNNDCDKLSCSLRNLTNKVIHGEKGLWKTDIEKIKYLETRRETIINSSLDTVGKIYWLLEDCKRYGTLPFAGLARAGFIAVQLLRSLVSVGILTQNEYNCFMGTLDTVSSKMSKDFRSLSKKDFLLKYGHLRPGTYDILSPRYDEDPDRYFDFGKINETAKEPSCKFLLSLDQHKQIEYLLNKHSIEHSVIGFFDFIKAAIEGREYAKFVFSHSLSDALSLFKTLGEETGQGVDDCSYVDISCIQELYSSTSNVTSLVSKFVEIGRTKYEIAEQIILPPLLIEPKDVLAFHVPSFEPNFITLNRTVGHTAFVNSNKSNLSGSVLFITNADPGYDWIFSRNINGFVTMYGGANSHMAIRAAELGIPAVIGAGEALYNKWSLAKIIELDCANKLVRIIK